MPRIAVTGGAGFLGTHLCERLLADGHDVTAVDVAGEEQVAFLMGRPRFKYQRASVMEPNVVDRLVRQSDVVFHFAAIADPKQYVEAPLRVLDLNMRATIDMLGPAADHGVKVAFASTSEIYGKNPHVPWKENDDRLLGSTAINRWCYATSKAVCEHYLYAYAASRGLKFVAYRLFNVYGPRQDDMFGSRVIPTFLRQYLVGDAITVHEGGRQTRTFAFVEDCVDACVRLAFEPRAEGEIFNVGSEREVSILELAEVMKLVGGFTSPIQFQTHREAFGISYEDIPRRVPDTTKLRSLTGWECRTSLEEGLRKTIEYYRDPARQVARKR